MKSPGNRDKTPRNFGAIRGKSPGSAGRPRSIPPVANDKLLKLRANSPEAIGSSRANPPVSRGVRISAVEAGSLDALLGASARGGAPCCGQQCKQPRGAAVHPPFRWPPLRAVTAISRRVLNLPWLSRGVNQRFNEPAPCRAPSRARLATPCAAPMLFARAPGPRGIPTSSPRRARRRKSRADPS